MDEREETNVLQMVPSTLSDPKVSPEQWIDRYAKVHGVEYHYRTHGVREQGEPIEPGIFISQMRLCAHQLGMGEVKRMLPDAYLVWRRNQARLYIQSLRNELQYQPRDADLVGDWVEAATGRRDELDVAVMRHFIWQVKRKLFRLPVEHHMMVVLFGKSGGGKSVAVHKLLAPISEVTSLRDLRIFNDQFARRAFARSYAIFFDELGRAEDADVNLLKSTITAPTVDWRGLGSESIHSAPQNSTFIGCSNSPLRERIHDPTSARRFWQLNCQDHMDWERINSIDYLSLWRSVDEEGACLITPFLDAIRVVQEHEIRQIDYIAEWLDYACKPEEFGTDSPGTETLFEDFNAWCGWRRVVGAPGPQTFARGLQLRIEQLGWSASSKRSHRGTVWSLKIKSPPPPEPIIIPIVGLAQEQQCEAVSVEKDPGDEA